MCRRSHGAGYVTWLITARDRFRVEAGEARPEHEGHHELQGRFGDQGEDEKARHGEGELAEQAPHQALRSQTPRYTAS